MPFEYRIIREAIKKPQKYRQLDLYFFKPKLTGVGIKIRFITGQYQRWKADQLELKFIKNTQDIQSNITLFQNWKKIQMPIELNVVTKTYMNKHPQLFKIKQSHTIEKAIKEQLQIINKTICDAIIREKIKTKHFEKNQDLRKWINADFPLVQIFAIQKSKSKSSKFQQGQLKIYPLYGSTKETLWTTVCFESHSEEDLRQKISKYGEQISENISYPKILDKLYFA